MSQTTLPERVLEWTQKYCDSLTENYKQHSVRMHQNYTSDWSKQQLESINNGTANLMKFVIRSGRKYYKIIQRDFDTFQNRNEYRDGSVHAFVDKKTGEVYKPASWNKPAKHVRYTFQDSKQLRFLLDPNNVGWAGGYLYMR